MIEIDLDSIKEPILCAPNDPDDARPLSQVAGAKIDEVFIGSCMTNIGHFRAAGKLLDSHRGQIPTRLWVAPPTRMDAAQLTEEGITACSVRVARVLRSRVFAVYGQPGSSRRWGDGGLYLDA